MLPFTVGIFILMLSHCEVTCPTVGFIQTVV